MKRRFVQAAMILVVLFAVAQLIRPGQANAPIDPSRTIQAHTSDGLAAVLDRSCGDCHSNRTVWPSYAQVAPLSWLMAYGVAQGRKAVNFSEWGAYPPERQRELMALMCQDVSHGRMPGPIWTQLHPEARLSPEDVAMICAATQQAEAGAK